VSLFLRRFAALAAYAAALVVLGAMAYTVWSASRNSVPRLSPGTGIPERPRPDGGAVGQRPPRTGAEASAARGDDARGVVFGVSAARSPGSPRPAASRPFLPDEDRPSRRP